MGVPPITLVVCMTKVLDLPIKMWYNISIVELYPSTHSTQTKPNIVRYN